MSIDRAKRVLEIEAKAVADLTSRLDDNFIKAVELILACQGKVIVVGIGKSGLVGRKIAATLASTGTPAFFVHPAEGVHGDVGMIDKKDVVLILSKSGETTELIALIPVFKRLGLVIIGLLGNIKSTLAKASDVVIDVSVKEEACPLQLAPTASTTAALAMGDALALCLLDRRGFTEEDFAKLHPSGSLGKKLLLHVSDVMRRGDDLPLAEAGATFHQLLCVMSEKMLGHAIVAEGERLLGVISDGDIRRVMEKNPDLTQITAAQIMTRHPKFVMSDDLAVEALQLMEKHRITALLVCDDAGGEHLVGIIHLKDLLEAGVV